MAMRKVLSVLFLFAMATVAVAQSDLTLYNFNAIPQSLHTNPAYPQQTKVWIGLPAISGLHAHFHNNGFMLSDLLAEGTDINENKNRIIDNLDDKSHIAFNQSIDLLGIGFRTGKGFFSMGATQSTDFKMDYPVDLLKLINYGNAEYSDKSLNVNSFDFEVMTRTNFYLGYQHTLLNDRLNIGGRFKYIIGQTHTYVERMNAEIYTHGNGEQLDVSTDILIRTAGVSGFVDDVDLNISEALLPSNSGFAVDLGGYYKLNDNWSVSASVLDLGLINWSMNTRDYVSKGSYSYDGIDADLSGDDIDQSAENVQDSLKEAFDFKEVDGEAYSQWLSTRIFAGVNYALTDKHTFGALYHARLWGGQMYHDMSVNYQGRLSRTFQFTASYSVINGTYNNVGAGFDLKLGAIQLYVLSDNILGAVQYANLQTSNVRVGINLTFYGKKKSSLPDDSPVEVPVNEPEEESPSEGEDMENNRNQ